MLATKRLAGVTPEVNIKKHVTCVTVLGYPLLPAWLLSDGRQALQGLDTDVTMFHNWLSVLQMAAPGAAI